MELNILKSIWVRYDLVKQLERGVHPQLRMYRSIGHFSYCVSRATFAGLHPCISIRGEL